MHRRQAFMCIGALISGPFSQLHSAKAGPITAFSLKAQAERLGLSLGFAMSSKAVDAIDDKMTRHLRQNASLLVPEGALKPAANQAKKGQFIFKNAGKMRYFCDVNGLNMKGHTLCWHESVPDWMRQELIITPGKWRDLLHDHIEGVLRGFPGLPIWDVVNESLAVIGQGAGKGRTASGFREAESPWWTAVKADDPYASGQEYVTFAFKAARQYDKRMRTSYADFGFEVASFGSKRAHLYPLLDGLCNDGTITDFSSHCHVRDDRPINTKNWSEVCQRVRRDFGLYCNISEIDFNARRAYAAPDLDKIAEEELYKVISTWLDGYRPGEQLIFWGVKDDQSAIQSPKYKRGLLQRPLIWDDNYSPKPIYNAVARALGMIDRHRQY